MQPDTKERVDIKEACRGRWRHILPALGVSARYLDGKQHPCPDCGGKDRFRFDDKEGRGTFFCNGCGAGDGIALVQKLKGWDFLEAKAELLEVVGEAPAAAPKKAPSEKWLREQRQAVWHSGSAITAGDHVNRYLLARGIELDAFPADLRSALSVEHQNRRKYPGMLARVVSPDGSRVVQVHRTFLTLDGRKADADPDRLVMPGPLPPGSAIRLAPVVECLGIGEGIETALSATILFGVPCWSLLNSGNLSKWEPPAGVKRIIVFGDNDPKFGGAAAAYGLGHRLAVHRNRYEVEVRIPPNIGDDWNDVLMLRKAAA